jgi:hypothetical protein
VQLNNWHGNHQDHERHPTHQGHSKSVLQTQDASNPVRCFSVLSPSERIWKKWWRLWRQNTDQFCSTRIAEFALRPRDRFSGTRLASNSGCEGPCHSIPQRYVTSRRSCYVSSTAATTQAVVPRRAAPVQRLRLTSVKPEMNGLSVCNTIKSVLLSQPEIR